MYIYPDMFYFAYIPFYICINQGYYVETHSSHTLVLQQVQSTVSALKQIQSRVGLPKLKCVKQVIKNFVVRRMQNWQQCSILKPQMQKKYTCSVVTIDLNQCFPTGMIQMCVLQLKLLMSVPISQINSYLTTIVQFKEREEREKSDISFSSFFRNFTLKWVKREC